MQKWLFYKIVIKIWFKCTKKNPLINFLKTEQSLWIHQWNILKFIEYDNNYKIKKNLNCPPNCEKNYKSNKQLERRKFKICSKCFIISIIQK